MARPTCLWPARRYRPIVAIFAHTVPISHSQRDEYSAQHVSQASAGRRRCWLPSVYADPENPECGGYSQACGYKSHHPGGAHLLMADASTHFVAESIDFRVLSARHARKSGRGEAATRLTEPRFGFQRVLRMTANGLCRLVLTLVLLVIGLTGCDSGRPKTIPISGLVLIDGQPPGEVGKLFFYAHERLRDTQRDQLAAASTPKGTTAS